MLSDLEVAGALALQDLHDTLAALRQSRRRRVIRPVLPRATKAKRAAVAIGQRWGCLAEAVKIADPPAPVVTTARPPAPQHRRRYCLLCDRPFQSIGYANRLCERCR